MDLCDDSAALAAALSFLDGIDPHVAAGERSHAVLGPAPASQPMLEMPALWASASTPSLALSTDEPYPTLDAPDLGVHWLEPFPIDTVGGAGGGPGLSASSCGDEETDSDCRSSRSQSSSSPPQILSVATLKGKGRQAKQTRRRPLGYNPNRAREERRREVHALRATTAELESQLAAIRGVRGEQGNLSNFSPGRLNNYGGSSGGIAESVWKAVATHQFAKRLASTRENQHLRTAVRRNVKTIERLDKLLRSQTEDRVVQAAHAAERFRLEEFETDMIGHSIFQRLLDGVTQCYKEVDEVFNSTSIDSSAVMTLNEPEIYTDESGNLLSRVFGSKIFPFSVPATGSAAWKQFSESVRPNARCFFQEIIQSTNDTVVERFGTELHLKNSKAVVHIRQVKRQYEERDRVVVVWQSHVDPLELDGQPLQGAAFEEKGFFVIHHPSTLPKGFAMLQTCYRISPHSPLRCVPQNSLAIQVTEFVLNWMATTIPANHQIIEDILVDQSLVCAA